MAGGDADAGGGCPRVVIYSRSGCHLCEEALAVIARARRAARFELVEIDIESDEQLLMRYLERIPVVTVDGQELFEYFVDEQALVDKVRG